MKYLIIIIILFISEVYTFSQTLTLIDFQIRPDYSKNYQRINDCLDKLELNQDTLTIEILHEMNYIYSKPIINGLFCFMHDTLILDYSLAPSTVDTIIQYDSIHHKYDTSFSVTGFIGWDNNGFSRLIYKLHGFSHKPENIIFYHKLIPACPTSSLDFEFLNGDTINVINSNGWKHGKWISEINSDSSKSVKVKYYNEGQFIKGYLISEHGDTTHCIIVSDDEQEMMIPYEFCK